MTRATNPISTVAVLLPLPDGALAKLRAAFKTVHYHPDFVLPAAVRRDVEYIFTSWAGLPSDVALADIPNVRHVQLGMAGADKLLSSPAIAEIAKRGASAPTVSTASGTHVVSIPQWVVGNVINLFHQMQSMISFARVRVACGSRLTHPRQTPAGPLKPRSTSTASRTLPARCTAARPACWGTARSGASRRVCSRRTACA